MLGASVFGGISTASAAKTKHTDASSPSGADEPIASFDPLFTARIPELEGKMEKTVGEALAMPSLADARAHRVAPTSVAREREETAAWIRRILRPALIDEKALDRLLAIRGGVQGRDGLFGAWNTPNGPLQIVATEKRIHVRVRLPKDVHSALGPARIEAAVALARQIFLSDLDWSKPDWQLRDLGAFTFAYRELPFMANWWESCLIVSDGTAVKFSFLKILHRDSQSGRGSGSRENTSWFRSSNRPRR